MGVVSRRWMWVEYMGVASGYGCKEVYRYPHTVGRVLIARFFLLRIASFSITRNQKNRRKKNMQLIIYCPLGISQSLKLQSGLYSAIRNRLTTQSKPDLRYYQEPMSCPKGSKERPTTCNGI